MCFLINIKHKKKYSLNSRLWIYDESYIKWLKRLPTTSFWGHTEKKKKRWTVLSLPDLIYVKLPMLSFAFCMSISKQTNKQTLKEDIMDIVKCFLFGHLVSKFFTLQSFLFIQQKSSKYVVWVFKINSFI